MEMTVKVIAKGFVCNKLAYLRSAWNCLDFCLVICGYISEIMSSVEDSTHSKDGRLSDDLGILRTFRVLRAVKVISILPGKR